MPLDPHAPSALVDALTVHVEPLVDDARVAVLGPYALAIAERLLEGGARTVHVYELDPGRAHRLAEHAPRGIAVRPLHEDFDVRDGAFDLVVVSDLGALPDPGLVARLRRVVDARGTVVAVARARTPGADESLYPELAPAAIEYAELYDLFAVSFDSVTMNGVLPFEGVVFAELGVGDDLAVSVDTRLVEPEPPGVFVVVASREPAELDPYAIVQIPTGMDAITHETALPSAVGHVLVDDARARAAETAFAAMQLKAELLAAQLDEHRGRIVASEGRAGDLEARLESASVEREIALTRAAELEGILVSAQQALADLERRLVAAERGMLERDDQIAALNAELDARGGHGEDLASVDPAVVADVIERAERAEAALALHIADLAQLSEAQAAETAVLEGQLRERASVISGMERELARREQMVRELVGSLDEAREGAPIHAFEAAPVSAPGASEEAAKLRRKLDDLALEVARREGELVSQAWKITELENELKGTGGANAGRAADLERDLMKARDELDALRQALTQEHAMRMAVESGEELTRARAELARQEALLEQLRGRQRQAE